MAAPIRSRFRPSLSRRGPSGLAQRLLARRRGLYPVRRHNRTGPGDHGGGDQIADRTGEHGGQPQGHRLDDVERGDVRRGHRDRAPSGHRHEPYPGGFHPLHLWLDPADPSVAAPGRRLAVRRRTIARRAASACTRCAVWSTAPASCCGSTPWRVSRSPRLPRSAFTGPIFATLGAALFLGERLRARRIGAILVAFGGAMIILRPGFDEISAGALAQLTAAPLVRGLHPDRQEADRNRDQPGDRRLPVDLRDPRAVAWSDHGIGARPLWRSSVGCSSPRCSRP